MDKQDALAELERLIRSDDGALFADEPAARAVAIVVELFARSHYDWPEWVAHFSAEVGAPGYFEEPGEGAGAALSGDGERVNRSYAKLWLQACEKLLVEKGLLTRSELDAKLAALRAGACREFKAGDRVVVRDVEPVGHAHLPLFVRGKPGVIERRMPARARASVGEAGDDGETNLQPVYSVRFAARTLWGPDAPAKDSVNFSLWQGYLERS